MPQRLLLAYIDMMPVIQAQESLRTYEAFACASSGLSKSGAQQARRIIARLQRQASGPAGIQFVRRGPPVNPANLAAMGIGYVEVPKRA